MIEELNKQIEFWERKKKFAENQLDFLREVKAKIEPIEKHDIDDVNWSELMKGDDL